MSQSSQLQRLLNFLEQDHDNAQLLMDITDLCLQQGDARAVTYSKQALDLAPNNPRARHLYGIVCLHQQAFEEAVRIFQQLLSEHTDNSALRYNLAMAKGYQGKMNEVHSLLEPVQEEILHNLPNAHLLYCRSLYHSGDSEATLQVLKSHIEQYPDDAEALGLLAMLFADLGEVESARAIAANALRIDPSNNEAQIGLATADLNDHEFAAADQQFEQILAHRPNSSRALLGRGLVALVDNRPADAEAQLSRTVEVMPFHLGSWSALGWAQIVQNKLDLAEQTFRQSLEIDGTFGENHGGLACALLMQGKLEEAVRQAKIAKRLDPESFSGRFAEALALQLQQNPEAAQQQLQNILLSKISPDGPTLSEALQSIAQKSLVKTGKD